MHVLIAWLDDGAHAHAPTAHVFGKSPDDAQHCCVWIAPPDDVQPALGEGPPSPGPSHAGPGPSVSVHLPLAHENESFRNSPLPAGQVGS
jgi:hypothetical protein